MPSYAAMACCLASAVGSGEGDALAADGEEDAVADGWSEPQAARTDEASTAVTAMAALRIPAPLDCVIGVSPSWVVGFGVRACSWLRRVPRASFAQRRPCPKERSEAAARRGGDAACG